MDTNKSYLTNEHKLCNKSLAETTNFVSTDHWERAENCFQQFCEALERHFAVEEKILFLTFENAIGRSEGPRSVMRNVHLQIRGVASNLLYALNQRDVNVFHAHAETLNRMIQHHLKKESLLYLKTDHMLTEKWPDISGTMGDFAPGT